MLMFSFRRNGDIGQEFQARATGDIQIVIDTDKCHLLLDFGRSNVSGLTPLPVVRTNGTVAICIEPLEEGPHREFAEVGVLQRGALGYGHGCTQALCSLIRHNEFADLLLLLRVSLHQRARYQEIPCLQTGIEALRNGVKVLANRWKGSFRLSPVNCKFKI